MHPISPAHVQVTESRRQELLATAATARLIASGETGTRRPRAVATILRGFTSALGQVFAHVPDSREALRSKEQDLAIFGITWMTDPVRDHALALELQAARARRRAYWLAPPAGDLLETFGTGNGASLPRIRRTLNVAIAR